MKTMQNPRDRKNISPSIWKNVSPRKNNTINWVAKSIQSIADKIST